MLSLDLKGSLMSSVDFGGLKCEILKLGVVTQLHYVTLYLPTLLRQKFVRVRYCYHACLSQQVPPALRATAGIENAVCVCVCVSYATLHCITVHDTVAEVN